MNNIDIFLQQSIIAAFFWVIAVMYLQQKWRIIDTYFGKKYSRIIVGALFILVWAQVGGLAILTLKSSWTTTPSLFFGVLSIAGSAYLLYTRRQSPFSVHKKRMFWSYMRLHTPAILLFFGAGFTTGKLGLLCAAFTYGLCSLVHAGILSQLSK